MQTESLGEEAEELVVNHAGACIGQLALLLARHQQEEVVRREHLEHRVAQEFEALVVRFDPLRGQQGVLNERKSRLPLAREARYPILAGAVPGAASGAVSGASIAAAARRVSPRASCRPIGTE